MMSELFKQISASNYRKWLLYGILSLVSVSVFPGLSIGWLCLNIVIFYLLNPIVIFLHELGHVFATICLGMTVTEVAIGGGKTIFESRLFGIDWKLKKVPDGGVTYILEKSICFYRSRSFLIALFGPLTNFILAWLPLRFPHEFITINPPGVYIFPGIIFCLINAIAVINNLTPQHIFIDGRRVPTDGLQMLTAPFLSQREVADRVSLSWLIAGHNWECTSNYQKAIESFNRAIQHNPACFQAYQRRGNAYRALKDNRSAIDNYQQAVDRLSNQIDRQQPLDRLSHEIELQRSNTHNYYARAMVYRDWMPIDPSKSQPAIDDLTKAIEIEPRNKDFHFGRAAIYCYSGCERQAIEDFTKLIQIASDADAYYNRGVSYYQFGNYQAALEDLDLAIDRDLDSISAYYSRGNARYQLQDRSGAVRDYDRAKTLSETKSMIPGDEHGFYARGIARIHLDDRVNAIADLQVAETLCLEYGNISLLQQIREKLREILT
jgi:tetratricopeptide (TPR) repeat protein